MKTKSFFLNSRILAGSAFLFVAGLLLSILMPTPAFASNSWGNYFIGSPYQLANSPGTDDFYTDYPQWSGTGSHFPGGGTALGFIPTYIQVKLHSTSTYTCSNIVNIDLYATNGSTSAGTTGSFTDIGGGVCQSAITGGANVALGYVAVCATGGCSSATSANMVLDGNSANAGFIDNGSQNASPVPTGGFAFQLCDTVNCPGTSFATPAYCNDGIMNGSETGIDIGGSCASVVINTPVDTTTVSDFSNFSVSYSGIDVPNAQHEIWVHWSDNSALITTCENGVMGGSLYGGTYVAGSSYSTCTNSIPAITIDENNISFSSGFTSWTGSIPKSKNTCGRKNLLCTGLYCRYYKWIYLYE